SVAGTIHPKLVDPGTATVGSDIRDNGRARLASLHTGDDGEFAFWEPDNRSEPPSARSPFGERFSFDQSSAPGWSSQSSYPSASFDDRFVAVVGEPLATGAFVRSAVAPPPAAVPPVATAVPLPRPAARSGVAQATPKQPSEPGFRLASASDTSVALAYAPSDPAKGSATAGSVSKALTQCDS